MTADVPAAPTRPPAPHRTLDPTRSRLDEVLASIGPKLVACSGGVDSLTLATLAHRADPTGTRVGHTVTPAVPAEATARVVDLARREGWTLDLVRSAEFDDERYLSNPTDRCYFCKTHLYDALDGLIASRDTATVVSGANLDDLGEYRPGLVAAEEHQVRHPYVEAGLTKDDVRTVARGLGLGSVAELPAAPCLASRLYTGTRVTADRLKAVELGEAVVRAAGVAVVRCRIREGAVNVEVADAERHLITEDLLDDVGAAMRTAEPDLGTVTLDETAYRPGRAILAVEA